MIDLRIAARDPGAANLLSHLLLEKGLLENHQCDIWLTDNLSEYFTEFGLPVRLFQTPPGEDELSRSWDDQPARAVLTGTSHYQPFDSLFWALGKRKGVPTLAVVDYWSNFGLRFKHGMPDTIGVIDEDQAAEADNLGCPKTIVTGHPALAAIDRLPTREQGDRVTVLFVSERIAGDVADGDNDPYGFDETDVFRLLLAAGQRAAQKGVRAELIVKFHPYNDRDAFLSAVGQLPDPSALKVELVDGREPIAPLVARSDLVTGVSSIAMVEAALMGRPVVSVQPGLCRDDMFIPGVKGYAETLTDPDEAVNRLAELIVHPAKRREVLDRLDGFRGTLSSAETAPVGDWLRSVLGPPHSSAVADGS